MANWCPGETLEYVERVAITQALAFYHGNKAKAAESLGCAVNTINNKLSHYQSLDAKIEADAECKRKDAEEFLARQRGKQTQPVEHALVPPIGESIRGPVTGECVESSPQTTPMASVHMPEREAVQELLPRAATLGRSGKRGG